MPVCELCRKRFRVLIKDCMILSFCITEEDGTYRRETHQSPPSKVCPKCEDAIRTLGPRKFLEQLDK
jgi:hypothetical protein